MEIAPRRISDSLALKRLPSREDCDHPIFHSRPKAPADIINQELQPHETPGREIAASSKRNAEIIRGCAAMPVCARRTRRRHGYRCDVVFVTCCGRNRPMRFPPVVFLFLSFFLLQVSSGSVETTSGTGITITVQIGFGFDTGNKYESQYTSYLARDRKRMEYSDRNGRRNTC
jgi:hypothetical protein